jgi:RNA polymerase sigma-70 factor (ECF subfamily)
LVSSPVRPPSPSSSSSAATAGGDEAWLEAFQRGDRDAFARCYEDYIGTVSWAVGQVLRGVDRETVVHDVFCRLFGEPELRRNFTGGNFGAWLITVARHQAIDFRRKMDRELPTDPGSLGGGHHGDGDSDGDSALELRSLVQRFLRILPPKWEGVFRARFLEHLDQRSAARKLGLGRTTLAYQEMQIRRRLRRFVLTCEREQNDGK